jgi:hypothetical protein
MAKSTDPIIAQWYHYPQKSEKFQVTAIEDHFDTVEVQYFDGTIGEFELTAWYAMEVEPVATPEDWTGPMDNIERDDLTPVGTEMRREDWDAPYDEEKEKTSAGPRISDEEQQRIADEEQQEET